MHSLQEAFQQLRQKLAACYDESEATAMAHELLEHITGKNKLQRLTEKTTLLTAGQEASFTAAENRLLLGEPLQYVTGIQWFSGNPFFVNSHVLIPRPETQELVDWVIQDRKNRKDTSFLDIGTGSGCIPVTLKLNMPDASVTSCDISKEALEVAQRNAVNLHADVRFIEFDFLDTHNWPALDRFDVIISNPPYIPLAERKSLEKNVRDFEPATALFVPDDDALLFYRQIALFGKTHLTPGGAIYCELHKDYATKTKALFEAMNYEHVTIRKDMHGNDRMLKAY